MKIYTKTGDDGTTGLYGGQRVRKDALRVCAYGSVDEANALLGIVRAQLGDIELNAELERIQNILFDLGADLATPEDSSQGASIRRIDAEDVESLEQAIDRYDSQLEPLRHFILPGGDPAAAALHLARTVVRRAEREVLRLQSEEAVNAYVGVYLNRLSDLLFVMARTANIKSGVSEVRWQAKKRSDMTS